MVSTSRSLRITATAFIWGSIPLVAIGSWIGLRVLAADEDTLVVRALPGSAKFVRVSWSPDQAVPQSVAMYRTADPHPSGRVPITVRVDPLPKNPESKGSQIWLFDVMTDATPTPEWQKGRYTTAPWSTTFEPSMQHRYAVLYSGEGEPKPFFYSFNQPLEGDLVMSVLQHPWSGRMRVTINDESFDYDLYNPGAGVRVLRWPLPDFRRDQTTVRVPHVPDRVERVRLFPAERPGSIRLGNISVDGWRRYAWKPGDPIVRVGPGIRDLAVENGMLTFEATDPDTSWIELPVGGLQARWIFSLGDWLAVLVVSVVLWTVLSAIWLQATGAISYGLAVQGSIVGLAVVLGLIVFARRAQHEHEEQAATVEIVDEHQLFQSTAVVNNLTTPVALAFRPSGDMFIVEKGGFGGKTSAHIKLWHKDSGTVDTVLDWPVCSNVERGLLGLALDPKFDHNGYLYVYYTTQVGECLTNVSGGGSPVNRVSRLTFRDGKIDPASEAVLVDGIPSFFGAHNAGCVRFGPDGALYVSTGEGRGGNESQDVTGLGGKILRINPDPSKPALPDNPFSKNDSPSAKLVWALGLRNPYRFGIHPKTGQIVIADVGSAPPKAREELNLGRAGANYGWPVVEGESQASEFTSPVYSYEHGDGCISIIGGTFLSGTAYPALYRDAFAFGDFGCGKIWLATLDTSGRLSRLSEVAHEAKRNIVHFETAPDGMLYYVDLAGSVLRLTFHPAGT
jgi:glucose/arabinose dehydrogenase